jgi:DNA-binding NtrC family response regulator
MLARLSQSQGIFALDAVVQESEKAAILAALAQCDNHRERTAQMLGISFRTLRSEMNRYSLR